MSERNEQAVGTVELLYRYPVKSMLGEALAALTVEARGVVGDRLWAVLDGETGKVASAKRPKLWRDLLTCTARTLDAASGGVEIETSAGVRHRAGDPAFDGVLTALTGRTVRLSSVPPDNAELDRAHPEPQTDQGPEADVASEILVLGGAAPPGTFLDYAPIHLMTTATIDALGDERPIEPARYRPNIVVRSLAGTPRFPENAWLGGTIRIGDTVALRVVLQTPRCAIPALAHGMLATRPEALRAAATRNRVDVPGFGPQPCAGIYAEVLAGGAIREDDAVTFTPA